MKMRSWLIAPGDSAKMIADSGRLLGRSAVLMHAALELAREVIEGVPLSVAAARNGAGCR